MGLAGSGIGDEGAGSISAALANISQEIGSKAYFIMALTSVGSSTVACVNAGGNELAHVPPQRLVGDIRAKIVETAPLPCAGVPFYGF